METPQHAGAAGLHFFEELGGLIFITQGQVGASAHNFYAMSEDLSPRESGKLIAETSQDVRVCREGVQKISDVVFQSLKNKEYDFKDWKKQTLHPKEMNDAAVDWIFMVDALNFSFWPDIEEEKFMVRYKGEEYTGFRSLCAAVNRALDEGIPVTSPSYYADITMDQLKYVFRSDSKTEVPLLEERHKVLRESGKILMERYNGSFVNCVTQCEQSAERLYKFIAKTFPSFCDTASYQGKTVCLYKRTQLVVADIWACFEGQGYGTFHDIDCLTMFADYRVPQAMVYFGALQYSDSLMAKLNANTLFTPGERHEVEIRGCSIWVVELVCEELKKQITGDPTTKNTTVNCGMIDFYLWDYAKGHRSDMEHIPIHKVRSVYY